MGACNKQLLLKLLCEFFGSMIVQFIGCSVSPASGSIVQAAVEAASDAVSGGSGSSDSSSSKGSSNSGDSQSVLYGLSWGAAVIAATQAFRIISGAHINPSVTIAAIIVKNITFLNGIFYILIQLLGSGVGYGISWSLVQMSFFKTVSHCLVVVKILPWWKSIFVELFITGAWVLAMCSSWHSSNEKLTESTSLRIGLVVALGGIVGLESSGASMNPWRALWPALSAQYWTYIYVTVLIPLATPFLVGFLWRFTFADKKAEAKPEE